MSRTDIIADAFTIIRHGLKVKKDEILAPYSKVILAICDILKKEGYVENFKEIDTGSFKKIKIYLKYEGKRSVINEIKRVSRPGRRVYVRAKKMPRVLNGYGIGIISTSQGIFTDKEIREKGLGGEMLGIVW